MYVLIKSNSFI